MSVKIIKKKIIAMTCMCVDVFDALGQIRPGGEALNFIANCCGQDHIERYIIGAIGNDAYGDRIPGQEVCIRILNFLMKIKS